MPELPEVETTRRGILPHLRGKQVQQVVLRRDTLRWPIPADLPALLQGQTLLDVKRRAKYLQLEFAHGTLLIHLGMSGGLRILRPPLPEAGKHDHADLIFADNTCLRFHDPRRFGAILWNTQDEAHPLLAELGPEPLSETFNADLLFARSRKKTAQIKSFIMNGRIVVGVGNIYASEALFRAGIHPGRAAGRISQERYERLCTAIKDVLGEAIQQGGTTLKDFTNSEGKPGYFAQQLQVYGREGQACPRCGHAIKQSIIGQRSSYFCGSCQR